MQSLSITEDAMTNTCLEFRNLTLGYLGHAAAVKPPGEYILTLQKQDTLTLRLHAMSQLFKDETK